MGQPVEIILHLKKAIARHCSGAARNQIALDGGPGKCSYHAWTATTKGFRSSEEDTALMKAVRFYAARLASLLGCCQGT